MTDDRPVIVVWFSCGAASAVAAYITLVLYGKTHRVRIVNNPVAEEDEDNRRFLKDVEGWLNHPIERAVNSQYPDHSIETVWHDRNYMSGPDGASCTHHLKRLARVEWENKNRHDFIVMGFTSEEKGRHDRFSLTERTNVLPVLIWCGLTKQKCFEFVNAHGLVLPRIYKLGYPNANCIGCIKATSPTYWNHVRQQHPTIFWQRALVARRHGKKLVRVNNERIFLDELSSDAKGRPMKQLVMPDCSIFCEEGRPEGDG